MKIDNFSIAYERLLKFEKPGDFFFIKVIKRRKDFKDKMDCGVNEDNRIIKHFFVYSEEYLRSKEAEIKQLCHDNGARAYILPQCRYCPIVMRELAAKTISLIDSTNCHFDGLMRSVVDGCHRVDSSRKYLKRWVVDIDKKEVDSSGYKDFEDFVCEVECRIRAVMTKFNSGCPNDVVIVPTRNGVHIITPPFNRSQEVFDRLFSGLIKQDMIKTDGATILYHEWDE